MLKDMKLRLLVKIHTQKELILFLAVLHHMPKDMVRQHLVIVLTLKAKLQ